MAFQFKDLPSIEDPYAKAGPAQTHTGKYEQCIACHSVDGDKWVGSPGFDVAESDNKEETDDKDRIGVWGTPADNWPLVPGKIDEDQARDTKNYAEAIELVETSFKANTTFRNSTTELSSVWRWNKKNG